MFFCDRLFLRSARRGQDFYFIVGMCNMRLKIIKIKWRLQIQKPIYPFLTSWHFLRLKLPKLKTKKIIKYTCIFILTSKLFLVITNELYHWKGFILLYSMTDLPWKLGIYMYWFSHSNSWNINWASKETYHFFRVTFTEIHCIKMIQIWS